MRPIDHLLADHGEIVGGIDAERARELGYRLFD